MTQKDVQGYLVLLIIGSAVTFWPIGCIGQTFPYEHNNQSLQNECISVTVRDTQWGVHTEAKDLCQKTN